MLEMMTLEERELYQTLPEQFEIFRGCGPDNMEGACWSLDPDVASRFPTLHRYQQTEPLLVTAIVQREQVLAVKLDRQEAEIITFYAKRLEVAELEAW